MLTIDQVVTAILARAENRYEVHFPSASEVAGPWADIKSIAVQLKRLNRESAGWRTVLITELSYESRKVQDAFRWAADVRDNLAEPQTADLYMFMLIEEIASEDAARLETDDRFCRKVVVREDENVESFLDRSFLATLSPSGSLESISDPLLGSLSTLGLTHSWVVPHLEAWRDLLLSGKSGNEVADALKIVAFSEEGSQ
ncbi:ABC-three component system middle component 1 [Pseudomonas amygdali]|uniref:ABC-three component system middle component 1 n=1 Tax=Pseudomonas amygdali TaxID=47877 RepID=UPI001C568D56|nr:ABC-three component system middle component 1 [Pseudomonas amygdali]QXW42683.1 hypothetical protein KXJ79_13045 [Pseudomonas amygdali]